MKEKMKKTIKIILFSFCTLLFLLAVLWCCLQYEVNYKKTICDTAVSPDGKYELTLQAIGEPAFPFGPADGRLILKKGEEEISRKDFVLYNDGGGISERSWTVTWHEECVEVILSGEEQADEQIILNYSGERSNSELADMKTEDCDG